MDKKNNKRKLDDQAKKILKEAENLGISKNFFFKTTFERYKMQIEILASLEKSIIDLGPTVEKEYIKGSKNIVVNPAITEYNKTSTAANGTLSALLNILKSVERDDAAEGSKLQELLRQF